MGGLREGSKAAVWMGAHAGVEGTVTRLYPGTDGWSWVVLRTEEGTEVSTHSAVVEEILEVEEGPREYAGTYL